MSWYLEIQNEFEGFHEAFDLLDKNIRYFLKNLF